MSNNPPTPFALSRGDRVHIQNFSDVIWIQTGFIGDIVLTTAAVAALKQEAPHITQHMITTNLGAQALSSHPMLSAIITFSKRDGIVRPILNARAEIRKLRLKNPVILQPHLSFRSSVLAKSLGFPVITFKETQGALGAFAKTSRVSILHESNRNKLLLESLGLDRAKIFSVKPALPRATASLFANQLVPDYQWIGIIPGSVWGTKRWPAAKFATITQLLLDQERLGIVLLGSKNEEHISKFIEDSCLKSRPQTRDKILNFTGKTALTDLNSIYPKLSLIVTNDSSSVHYGSAFNVPTLEIFGATVPSMGFGPLAPLSQVAEIKLPCRPCSDHGPQTCPLGHFKCMNDLGVDAVMSKINLMLQAVM